MAILIITAIVSVKGYLCPSSNHSPFPVHRASSRSCCADAGEAPPSSYRAEAGRGWELRLPRAHLRPSEPGESRKRTGAPIFSPLCRCKGAPPSSDRTEAGSERPESTPRAPAPPSTARPIEQTGRLRTRREADESSAKVADGRVRRSGGEVRGASRGQQTEKSSRWTKCEWEATVQKMSVLVETSIILIA